LFTLREQVPSRLSTLPRPSHSTKALPREKTVLHHDFSHIQIPFLFPSFVLQKPFPMAIVKNNIVTQGLSGKLGDTMVFRQRGEQTIAAKAPIARGPDGTPPQLAARQKFQQASIFGKAVSADPIAKAPYQALAKERQTAYNVAVADFFLAPDIQEIDVSNYTGQAGETIKIEVTDDFKVQSVKVYIHNEDGSMVEEGDAKQEQDSTEWIYTTTTINTNLSNDKITITASDIPANLASREIVLE
jgi:hypothetical protein